MTQFARRQSSISARSFAVLPAAALLLAAITALAESAPEQARPDRADDGRHHGPGNGDRLFERWDKDHDGRITIADLPTRLQQHIRAVDQNKDGILTREEFEKGKAQLAAQREKELDRNGDGKITAEERRETMRDHLAEHFIEQDKNHDGALTEAEVGNEYFQHIKVADTNSDSKVTLAEIMTAFDQGKLLAPHGGGPASAPRTEAEMKVHAQQRFNAEDKNHDGYLTADEVPQRWAHIKVADANQDNKITFDELTAAFKSGKLGRMHHQEPGRGN
jgi:Ca2+-binding EF-hand superfamily protein